MRSRRDPEGEATDPVEIAYVPAAGRAELRPAVDPPRPGSHEVLVRTLRVGFCGTDREIVRGAIAVLPDGAERLVLGHEVLGVVEAVGDGVDDLEVGTRVVSVVRSECGRCVPCDAGRPDFCLTGDYVEHGITRIDGFARPSFVVARDGLVGVPHRLDRLAVLAEPVSIVEKALGQAAWMRSRIPGIGEVREEPGSDWGRGLRALVAGAGTIGLLATYLLRERGFTVETLDVRDPEELPGQLVRAAGAVYTQVDGDDPAAATTGPERADVVVEAAGDPHLAFELLKALDRGGVLVWVGAFDGERLVEMDVGRSLLGAVVGHHALVGTVNSGRHHLASAVSDLERLVDRPRFDELVTEVVTPDRFERALWPDGVAIKQVVCFSE